MAKTNTYLHALNIGVHDKTALTRVDLERMRLAAEEQTNLLCLATGPAFMRPGFEYLTGSDGNKECRLKEFIFGAADAALMEFTDTSFRVLVDDEPVTRSAVSSAVINGDFSSATGWTTTGVGGGSASISGGKLTLNAQNVEAIAQCSRSVTTSSPGVEHALRIVVERGPVIFRCGSTASGDEYIPETSLQTGEHSLAFTPSGTYYVQFSSQSIVDRIVSSIQVEAAGIMKLPTPWALSQIPYLRIAQSADVCFVTNGNYRQRRIERRSRRSWSVAYYTADDGPFTPNPRPRIRLRPLAMSGNTVLQASAAYFNQNMVGMLFRLDHSGQKVDQTLSSEDTYTDPIRISGIENDRIFPFSISGTWTGTVTLQRSFDDEFSGFIPYQTFVANTSANRDDGDDNSITWYRLGFAPGGYSSGVARLTMSYDGGGGYGICRVTNFISATQVGIEVLKPFKNTVYTRDWQPGEWSDDTGWPSAVALADGRLWQSGADRIWGSVSDAFSSYNEETEGDSAPISRSIATGGVNDTKWLLSLQRLLAGTEGAISTVKSSSLDEPITPTNFGIRDSSTTGAASIDPIKVDTRGIFVERAGTALLELTFDGSASDYTATQISKLTTDLFASGVKDIAIQRRPDTRVWLTLNDGSAVCMVYEADQEVLAFIPIETDGAFESIAVLPDLIQDRVYASIRRSVKGASVRYIEKMAMDREVKPATLCKTSDSFITFTNSPASATVSGLGHLIGRRVVAWVDGAPVEESPGVPAKFTVANDGTITLPSSATTGVVGLAYPNGARYKSSRLAYGAANGTAMLQKKSVDELGFILTDFVRSGIKIGPSFDDPYRGLYPLPEITNGSAAKAIVLSDIHDEEPVTLGGEWNTDSRVCFECRSPYTMTVLGMVLTVTTNER